LLGRTSTWRATLPGIPPLRSSGTVTVRHVTPSVPQLEDAALPSEAGDGWSRRLNAASAAGTGPSAIAARYATSAVAAEAACPVLMLLAALTVTCNVKPASADPTTYVEPLAPAIDVQFAPVASQRDQL